jgi:hypothetical protein
MAKLPPKSLSLKEAIAIFIENLENRQLSTQRISERRHQILNFNNFTILYF